MLGISPRITARPRPADQSPIISLLQDLSACLTSFSEDPSSLQCTEGEKISSKLRNALLMLITHCVEGGSETEFVDVSLVAQSAIKRFPDMFREENCRTVVSMLRLLVGLYSDQKARSFKASLRVLLTTLLDFLSTANREALNLILAGHTQLITEIAKLLSASQEQNTWEGLGSPTHANGSQQDHTPTSQSQAPRQATQHLLTPPAKRRRLTTTAASPLRHSPTGSSLHEAVAEALAFSQELRPSKRGVNELGPIVQEWVAWYLSGAAQVFATADQLALVTCIAGGYLGACLAHHPLPDQAAKSSHGKAASKSSAARDISLSKDDLKALMAQAWADTSQPSQQQATQQQAAEDPAFTATQRCARVSSMLIMLAASMLDLPDEQLPSELTVPWEDAVTEAQPVTQIPMIGALGKWLPAASEDALMAIASVIRPCVALAGSGAPEVRRAVREAMPAMASLAVLQPAYEGSDAEMADHGCFDTAFMQELKKMLDAEEASAGLQELLRTVLAATAVVEESDALFLGHVMAVDCLGHSDPAVRATAADGLEGLARKDKVDLQYMILQMPRLLEYVGCTLVSRPAVFVELAEVLDMDEPDLAAKLIPCALPTLASKGDMRNLTNLARVAQLTVSAMIHEHALWMLAEILYKGGDPMPVMVFLKKALGDQEVAALLSPANAHESHIAEVLRLAASDIKWGPQPSLPDSIVPRILYVFKYLDWMDLDSLEVAAEFIHAYTVPILKELGDQLNRLPFMDLPRHHPTTVRRGEVILRSVLLIIKLLGPKLQGFLPLILVLLQSSLGRERGSSEREKLQSLEGWSTLVQALATDAPQELGNIANQVVVAMLEPLTEGGQVSIAAARVVQGVVDAGQASFKEQLKRLPPLPPSIPALQRCNAVLTEARGPTSAEDHITAALDSLKHHSLAVRANALQELRSYLHTHRTWLAGLLSSSSSNAGHNGVCNQSQLLSRMLSGLLKCCDPEAHDPSSLRAQQACAECLGLLGAVDPARVAVELSRAPPLRNSDTAILLALINDHLVRLLRVASSMHHLDSAALAIQELLKHYANPEGLTVDSAESIGGTQSDNELYRLLAPDVQALVCPYLTSRYTLTGTTRLSRRVVFNSELGASFRRWLSTWLRLLIEHHTSGKWNRMFQACAMVAVFSLLDILKAWLELRKQAAATTAHSAGSSGTRSSSERELPTDPEDLAADARVAKLVAAIPGDLLAHAAHTCGAHARALQYYEQHVRESKGNTLNSMVHAAPAFTDGEVSFMQEVYGKLEEPDGLAGLARLRPGGPRFEDQMLAAEKAGHWGEALTLYEQAMRKESMAQVQRLAGSSTQQAGTPVAPEETARLSGARKGYLKCLLQMGHMEAVMAQVDGWSLSCPEGAKPHLAASGVAAAWRLGKWEALDTYLSQARAPAPQPLDGEQKWDVCIGQVLARMHQRSSEAVKADLEEARRAVMAPLSAASMESHVRAYPYLVNLHMLGEAADCAGLLQEGSLGMGHLERQRRLRWDERLAAAHPSLTTQEPILALRRQLAQLTGAEAEAGKCFLAHGKLCRAGGHYQAAMTATLEALSRDVPNAPIQHAKLLWDMNEPHRAIMQLQQVLQQAEAGSAGAKAHQSGAEQKKSEASMVLQLARWTAETGEGAKADIKALFAQAVSLHRPSEKVYFHYALYLDQLMRDAKERQTNQDKRAPSDGVNYLRNRQKVKLGEDEPFTDILKEVLYNYGTSVQHGIRHVYQTLPRMLTVWFEFGSYCLHNPLTSAGTSSADKKKVQQEKATRNEIFNVMQSLAKHLPMYVWLVALSQLTSRICHAHNETKLLTQHILTRVIAAFPHQALWAMAAVSKSNSTARRLAASAIISSASSHSASTATQRLIKQFPGLCDQVIRLCNHAPAGKLKTMSAKSEFGPLMRMMPLDVMIPATAGLTLALPASGCCEKEHNPFGTPVTLAGIQDNLLVLSSLQKPKRMVMVGSDGREYPFLAKPKDDLRKDHRMMEIAGVLNRLFAKEPASRRRNLYIRRFAVTPLTEDCGLIEWVSHTGSLREALTSLYVAEGLFDPRTSHGQIRHIYEKHIQAHKEKKRTELLDRVLTMYPPRMHRWQLARFPEPAAWHAARMAFTRTAAVWSMVGHIVGLGDRHGENLLLDASTGDIVQVDFSCLFDRGLTLETPEVVPFRLTQNLIDGCGVAGIEGAFRRTAEVSLSVLRQHRATLVSVLETFVHDPLVDWTKHDVRTNAEGENPQAQEAINIVQGRLTGTLLGVKSIPSMPLSPEGQALRLIKEATDKENLGSMYVWWQPWL
ncbi:hypothetical protein WJX73_002849 [Symbiochloris irregularis]|uniref:Serine/threonine-protein kinase ATR n=1 Tax=Symbiochloris irregularis TaxID=706552 RepID=A0AAW1PCY5_9CHLO